MALAFKIAWVTTFLYILIAIFTDIAIYKHHTENRLTRFVEGIFPYPAAVVNGEVVPLDRFRQGGASPGLIHASRHDITGAKKDIEFHVMNQLVNKVLYAQAIQKNGIILKESDVDKRMDESYPEVGGRDKVAKFLAEKYGEEVDIKLFRIWIKESLVEAAIKNQLLTRVTVRHVLIALPDNPSEKIIADGQKRAQEVKAKITSTDQFGAVAKEFSEDLASRDKGGSLGTTIRTEQPVCGNDFQEALFTLPIGQISDPIRTTCGWHIILIDNRDGKINKSLAAFTGDLQKDAKIRKFLGITNK